MVPVRRRRARMVPPWLLVLLVVGSSLALMILHPPPRTKTVATAPGEVILSASDIPEVGWGVRASGTDGTAAWRVLAVHNELILAILNVTLWVEPSDVDARDRMEAVGAALLYPPSDGGVEGSDGSVYWSYASGHEAGMLVRRYNVAFVLEASLESSFALTRSDLASWSALQLTKVEALAK